MAQRSNLDMTLLTFMSFLTKIHEQFFCNFEKKMSMGNNGIHKGCFSDIKHYIDRCLRSMFDQNLQVSLKYFVKWDDQNNAIIPAYEENLC